jgi:hypothetical protein
MQENRNKQNEAIKNIANTIFVNGFGQGFVVGEKVGEMVEAQRTIDEYGSKFGDLLNSMKGRHKTIDDNNDCLKQLGINGKALMKNFYNTQEDDDKTEQD